jgi:hypothetical protein
MKHRIFTGSFAALEVHWLEEIARLRQGNPLEPIAVLTGSNLLASYLKRRIAEQGRAVANLHFHTFLDLSRSLAVDWITGKPRLARLCPTAILESILTLQPAAVFQEVAGYAGFRDALLDTFRDLRDAGVAPAQLELGVRRAAVEAPERRDHLSGLSLLYRLFREKVEQFRGVDDDFRTSIRAASRAAEILGCGRLLVYGIYDVTGQQSDLLTGLKDALEMTYFIPFVNDEVSMFVRPFLDARERELDVRAEPLATADSADSLGKLRQRDFGFGTRQGRAEESAAHRPQPLGPDGSFALVSAPGESRAAVEIVREVLRAAKDGVIRGFHEAAVILRQPELEVPILTEALRLRNIPCFVGGGVPFARRPLSRAVLALAGLESKSFSRQAILAAMEWISASLPPETASLWQVAEWRSLTNRPPFLAGLQAWDDGTAGLLREATRDLHMAQAQAAGDGQDEGDDHRPAPSVAALQRRLNSARALRRAWEDIRQAASSWPAAASWCNWAEFLHQQLQPLLGTASDWQVFSNVLEEIGALADMAGRAGIEEDVSRAKLTAALGDSLSSLSCAEGRFMRNGINLISAEAARGLRFPLVIIPGLEEGRFPARLRQDPLLLDVERRRIDARLPLKSQRGMEERLLFDMAARSAQRRLVLLSSRLDEGSDRERIPSEFFLRAVSAASGCAVGMRDLAEEVVPGFRSVSLDNPAPAPGQVAVDRGEIRLRLITETPRSAKAVLAALVLREPSLLQGSLAYDESRWQPRLTVFDGRLSDPILVRHVARILGPAAGPTSSSRLEEYAKCPYLFFLKRVLGLEVWEEQEAPLVFDPLERGRLIHEVLEEFLDAWRGELFAAASAEELRGSLLAQARPVLEAARPAGMPSLLWEVECSALEKVLLNWIVFEKNRIGAGLIPAHLERPFGKFGPEEDHPDLRIRAGEHEFVFRGRIDRIDLSRDGRTARVIDYKTGKRPDSMARQNRPLMMAGEKIQVAVYPQALRLLEGLGQVDRIEGEYLHLQPRDGQIVQCAFSGGQLEEATRRLPHLLSLMGDGLVGGVFFARTGGSVYPDGHCRHCDYLSICGKDRVQREERKAADPAVLAFQQMAEIDQPWEGVE